MTKNSVWKTLKGISPPVMQLLVVFVVLATAYIFFNLGAGRQSQGTNSEVSKMQNEADLQGSNHKGETDQASEQVKTIWTCSMHPQIKRDEPGTCPICGMDLVPAETTASAPIKEKKDSSNKPIGYACAMNCVPPLPHPGKCPVCGMDMVAVYEEPGSTQTLHPERQLVISEEAKALAAIQTSPVERRWVENEVRLAGNLNYDETRVAAITAYIAGRLDRLYVDYTGIKVNKGDHMVYIYSPDLLTAQEELLQAKSSVERLKNNAATELQSTAGLALDSARERLRLWGLTEQQIAEIENQNEASDHLTIYSPLTGIVIKKHVNEGDYVQTGSRIYTIADLTHLWVELKAYESDLPWLHYGQDVAFTVEAYPGEEFHGRISFISPILDPMTRTVDVRVNVDNADNKLKPGLFVQATVRSKLAKGGKVIAPDLADKWISPMHPEIIKDHPGKCDVCGMDLVPAGDLGFVASISEEPPLVIPSSAPLITGKRAVVYVQIPNQEKPTFEGREIILGPRAGDHYIVVEGLMAGEQVVTNGAFKIDSALQIIARPSMMNPEGGRTMTGQEHHGAGSDMKTPQTPTPPSHNEMGGSFTKSEHQHE